MTKYTKQDENCARNLWQRSLLLCGVKTDGNLIAFREDFLSANYANDSIVEMESNHPEEEISTIQRV